MRKRKYQVSLGKEFDVGVEVDGETGDEPPEHGGRTEQKDRMRLAGTVFGAAMAFLVGAAVLGIVRGDFAALNGVWSVASVPVSSILTFYFTRK